MDNGFTVDKYNEKYAGPYLFKAPHKKSLPEPNELIIKQKY